MKWSRSDRLLDALWGDHPPRTAREALQNAVSQVRKTLGSDILVTRAPGYAIVAAREQIDLGEFELLTAQARMTSDPATQVQRLRAALALWRGAALADLAFEPFAVLELPRLNGLRLNAQHDLVDAELALARHAELLPEIASLVAEHPFDERLRCKLALALYRSGRQAAALDACREARRALVDELGIDPTDELRMLEQRILRQDSTLTAPAPPLLEPAAARKTVTVLAVELEGGPDAADEFDAERLHALLDHFAAVILAAAERHGGAMETGGNGAATVVFGLAAVHEDDPLRAVRAAVDARGGLASLEQPLSVCIGVATGEVYAAADSRGGRAATGLPFRTARRLANGADGGEILLGGSAFRLVRGAVRAEPFAQTFEPEASTFRLLSLVEGASAVERRLDAPLVGRERELAELRALFDRVSRGRTCVAATVIGEAGIGKTRLVTVLASELGSAATVAIGRCVSYGSGATYRPLEEVVAALGGRLAALLAGVDTTGEQFLAVRRFLEQRARERPLLLVFEDVHWAETTLLDLIDYLGERIEDAPVLVLSLARPDLLETRPLAPATLRLAPLDDVDAEALLAAMSPKVEPTLGARIVIRAEGNPLYVEHLLAYALEGGEPESLPPTLDALLAGRIGRLRVDDQTVLQGAAAIGREFTHADIERLELPGAESLDRSLETLTATGLLRRASGSRFRFDHVLVRDSAYAGTPKARRADLHESFAATVTSGPDNSDELVGYHLEQAYRYRSELGLADVRTRRLATEAGARLGDAGLRAWKRHDTPAAVNLLGRAAALMDETNPCRFELLCELGVALRGAGEISRAEQVLAETAAEAKAAHDARAEQRARLELANVRLLSSPGGRAEELLSTAREAIPVFEAADDDRGLFRAWRFTSYAEGAMRCQYAASSRAATRALRYGRRSGWSTAACLGDVASAQLYGPVPVPKAIARCRALMRDVDLAAEANVLVPLAGLEAMRGRFAEARAHVTRAETIHAELGQIAFAQATGGGMRGEIELLAGDAAAAERAFRESYDALARVGDRAYLATRAVQLAEALHLLGRNEEALRCIRLAEEVAAEDDVPTQFLLRSIQARLLAGSEDPLGAKTVADDAVRLAEGTDALWQHAKVVLGLAEVLWKIGRPADAAAAGARSLALHEQKGSTVGAGRARALLDAIDAE